MLARVSRSFPSVFIMVFGFRRLFGFRERERSSEKLFGKIVGSVQHGNGGGQKKRCDKGQDKAADDGVFDVFGTAVFFDKG